MYTFLLTAHLPPRACKEKGPGIPPKRILWDFFAQYFHFKICAPCVSSHNTQVPKGVAQSQVLRLYKESKIT